MPQAVLSWIKVKVDNLNKAYYYICLFSELVI